MMRRAVLGLAFVLALAGLGAGAPGWSTETKAAATTAAPSPATREEFRRLIYKDRKQAELRPQRLSESTVGNNRVEKIRFSTEDGQEAVALLYSPKAPGRYPAVILQHYYGGTKDNFLFGSILNGLAQKGIVGVAIDGRYRGERQNGKSLEAAMVEALRTGKGHPWLIDTAYDVLRLVDYLQTRPDVDPERIGMSGISEGGILTWMCAAADDRIRVAAPIVGVTAFSEAMTAADGPEIQAKLKLFQPVLQEFAKDLGEMEINGRVLRTAWERLIPGSLDRFDAPSLVPQIAPRPLLIMNHEQDEIIPIGGARTVYEAARRRYQALNVADRLEFRVSPGLKHSHLTGLLAEANTMGQWMERWLKSPSN